MKRNLLLFATLLLSLTMFAHAPKKVELSYDEATKELTVTITHPVKSVKDHFINIVTVSINGEEIKKEIVTEQSSLEKHICVIKLQDVKSGDVITANGNCNKLGNRSGSITLE